MLRSRISIADQRPPIHPLCEQLFAHCSLDRSSFLIPRPTAAEVETVAETVVGVETGAGGAGGMGGGGGGGVAPAAAEARDAPAAADATAADASVGAISAPATAPTTDPTTEQGVSP